MKKTVLGVLSTVLVVGMLAGCGGKKDESASSSPSTSAAPATTAPSTAPSTAPTAAPAEAKYADGVYYAEGADFDAKTGWKEVVALKVEGGKITNVNWTGLNKDGGIDKKTYAAQGKYGMKKAGSALEWNEQAAKAEAFLIEKQDPKEIPFDKDKGTTDAITGVSIHVSGFAELAEKALAAGPVQAGPYKDGTYHAEAADFDKDSGWKDTVDVTVLNGKIFAVRWSGVNKDGADKVQFSKDGKYGMKKGGASSEWHEQSLLAEKALLEKQDPAAITVKDDGKTDAISGVSIHVAGFTTLAAKALEGAK
ncbi:hypothetical protein [Gorillibacterium massiliense]|uniref:hypothetical protein n=1 Tax=Gorillibacterium massiliense TaxID=1280390 RepID=UPI0004AE9706|nr:hypothetical protein [Gorillibacterium massiliense]